MGSRSLGFIEYKQAFLYPDEETYEAFANTVLDHWMKVLEFQERKFKDRGVECLKNDDPIDFLTVELDE